MLAKDAAQTQLEPFPIWIPILLQKEPLTFSILFRHKADMPQTLALSAPSSRSDTVVCSATTPVKGFLESASAWQTQPAAVPRGWLPVLLTPCNMCLLWLEFKPGVRRQRIVLNASLLVWDLLCGPAPDTYVMLAAANEIRFIHHVNCYFEQ